MAADAQIDSWLEDDVDEPADVIDGHLELPSPIGSSALYGGLGNDTLFGDGLDDDIDLEMPGLAA